MAVKGRRERKVSARWRSSRNTVEEGREGRSHGGIGQVNIGNSAAVGKQFHDSFGGDLGSSGGSSASGKGSGVNRVRSSGRRGQLRKFQEKGKSNRRNRTDVRAKVGRSNNSFEVDECDTSGAVARE